MLSENLKDIAQRHGPRAMHGQIKRQISLVKRAKQFVMTAHQMADVLPRSVIDTVSDTVDESIAPAVAELRQLDAGEWDGAFVGY